MSYVVEELVICELKPPTRKLYVLKFEDTPGDWRRLADPFMREFESVDDAVEAARVNASQLKLPVRVVAQEWVWSE